MSCQETKAHETQSNLARQHDADQYPSRNFGGKIPIRKEEEVFATSGSVGFIAGWGEWK